MRDGTIVPKPEKNPPTVPMDYSWAQVSRKWKQAGLIKNVNFFWMRENPERMQKCWKEEGPFHERVAVAVLSMG